MDKDEIIRSPLGREQLVALAREVGLWEQRAGVEMAIGGVAELERFAALVAEPWIETNKALAKEIIEMKKQAEQEPVGKVDNDSVCFIKWLKFVPPNGTKLYAAPVRTKDLTDDEIETIFEYWYSQPETEVWSTVDFARAVIAKLREKECK